MAVKVWEAIFVILIGAALAQGQAPPQLTEDQRKAQELLKKTIEERQKNHPQTNASVNANPNAQLNNSGKGQPFISSMQQCLRSFLLLT